MRRATKHEGNTGRKREKVKGREWLVGGEGTVLRDAQTLVLLAPFWPQHLGL